MEALYKRETGVQLSQMKKECDSWSHNSHRLAVFSTLMTEAGPAVGHFTDLVVDIFNIMLSRLDRNLDYILGLAFFTGNFCFQVPWG